MRNLVIILMIIFTSTVSIAQESFVETYKRVVVKTYDDELEEYVTTSDKDISTTIFFNMKNTYDCKVVSSSGTSFILYNLLIDEKKDGYDTFTAYFDDGTKVSGAKGNSGWFSIVGGDLMITYRN